MTIYQHMAEELLKIAEEKKEEAPKKHGRLGFWGALGVGGKTIGGTLLGSGLGTATGIGAYELANYIHRKSTGQPIPDKYKMPIATFFGGLGGTLSTNWMRPKMLQEARRAIEGE